MMSGCKTTLSPIFFRLTLFTRTAKSLLIVIIIASITAHSCRQAFTPCDEYIEESKGKWRLEIPEVQELVLVVVAISPIGQGDKNMVMHDTPYYDEVMNHFRKYRDHPVVAKVNDLLDKGLYAHVKMDACGFHFDDQDRIAKATTYDQLNWTTTNYVEPLVSALEDFSRKSSFREFYRKHQSRYSELIRLASQQMPVDKQWKWLEERFPARYDHYWITFSPLVNGSHSTNRFAKKGFRQSVMFVCGPIESEEFSDPMKEALMSRVVFTEIDHNYINPVSDKFIREINAIFQDRSKWTVDKLSRDITTATRSSMNT